MFAIVYAQLYIHTIAITEDKYAIHKIINVRVLKVLSLIQKCTHSCTIFNTLKGKLHLYCYFYITVIVPLKKIKSNHGRYCGYSGYWNKNKLR